MKRLWWWIGVGGRVVITLFFFLVCGVLFLPFFGSLPREFTNLSGEQAAARIGYALPEGVMSKDIEKASGKAYSQIDCHAHWLQIVLRPDVANQWQDAIHMELEKSARIGGVVESIEGVHRVMARPAFVESKLGQAPTWWKPPSLGFRVTERMRWDSGGTTYANALYSEFDPATNTLWIYDYGQQHGRLWSRGEVPAGDQFVLGGAKNPDGRNGEAPQTNASKDD